MPDTSYAPIAERFVPPVSGVDIEQSLNFVSAEGLPLAWFYEAYTYPETFYTKGSRPRLEAFLRELVPDPKADLATVRAIVEQLPGRMVHFCSLGYSGEMGRGLSEEALIDSGLAWCNEQARVLVALTQIAGLVSRLVYARGHVMTEVLVEAHWILIDQTISFVFEDQDGNPINVLDIKSDPAVHAHASKQYRAALQADRARTDNKEFWDFIVTYGSLEDPLIFLVDGYLNYFIH